MSDFKGNATFSNDACTSANEAVDIDENPAADTQATRCKVSITFMSGTQLIVLNGTKKDSNNKDQYYPNVISQRFGLSVIYKHIRCNRYGPSIFTAEYTVRKVGKMWK